MKRHMFFILVQLLIDSTQATIKFGDLKCDVLRSEVVSLEKCRIQAVNRTYNIINIKYVLEQQLSEVNMKLLKRERGGWHPFLYDFTIDVCDFFKRPYKYVVFNIIYKYGQRFTNLNHTCPYSAKEEILLKDWTLFQTEILQKFPVDLGVYAVHTTWYTNKKKFLHMNGSVVYE